MKLEIEMAGDHVQIIMTPADDLDMMTFGQYFPQAEVLTGGGGDTMTLQIVRILLGRAEFQRSLAALGLTDTGGAGALKVSSIAAGEEDAAFRCLRLDPRHDPTECQNLAVPDHRAAILACEVMARSNNWFGGRAEEGACSIG